MKRNVGLLILALSLLFNLFFAAGYLRARTQLGISASPDDVPRLVQRELRLDDEQAAVYSRLRSSAQQELAPYGEALALAEQELLDELRRDAPRRDRLDAIIQRRTELEQECRRVGSQRFGDFVDVLSPEQRERMARHMPLERRRHGMMQRYDANRDGILDETEKAAARAHHEERRRNRDERLDRLFDEFDADGDGQLDRDEWTALRTSLAKSWGRPGGPRRGERGDRGDRRERPGRPERAGE